MDIIFLLIILVLLFFVPFGCNCGPNCKCRNKEKFTQKIFSTKIPTVKSDKYSVAPVSRIVTL